MICCICGLGPIQGISIFRVNKKGDIGIFACRKHMGQGVKIDKQVDTLVKIMEKRRDN